ncbi:MAG: SDR family NAD(P)-dependent oxidoreductase [Planctomycetes bacterium]|nr:SDR family NAD(P)-dependent oxidoreductase [Planctomycetota bacterium]
MLVDRQTINIVGPALRALLAAGDQLKWVRFDAAGSAGDVTVKLPDGADTADRIVQFLQQALDRQAAKVSAVVVADLGTFHVRAPTGDGGRVAGKVVFVTGAAQGFGLEIARDLVGEGAAVVLADINEPGVLTAAKALAAKSGPDRVMGLCVDVTDATSVERAMEAVVRNYGGLDVLISNAGVLKAESVKTQPMRDFDFVTAVNYKGYFLCVQKAAAILAVQHAARPAYTSDIIQINSKSGLAGSKCNGAYAGSKFGGLGLTQSFALELIDDGIKVNAICPGNFFDGPLWSDPQDGLFVQYLRAGKVPGAASVAEVRRAYEAKVPMGRGCTTVDVMKAIYYVIEQQYETGQAIPVTGGQVMLS